MFLSNKGGGITKTLAKNTWNISHTGVSLTYLLLPWLPSFLLCTLGLPLLWEIFRSHLHLTWAIKSGWFQDSVGTPCGSHRDKVTGWPGQGPAANQPLGGWAGTTTNTFTCLMSREGSRRRGGRARAVDVRKLWWLGWPTSTLYLLLEERWSKVQHGSLTCSAWSLFKADLHLSKLKAYLHTKQWIDVNNSETISHGISDRHWVLP